MSCPKCGKGSWNSVTMDDEEARECVNAECGHIYTYNPEYVIMKLEERLKVVERVSQTNVDYLNIMLKEWVAYKNMLGINIRDWDVEVAKFFQLNNTFRNSAVYEKHEVHTPCFICGGTDDLMNGFIVSKECWERYMSSERQSQIVCLPCFHKEKVTQDEKSPDDAVFSRLESLFIKTREQLDALLERQASAEANEGCVLHTVQED